MNSKISLDDWLVERSARDLVNEVKDMNMHRRSQSSRGILRVLGQTIKWRKIGVLGVALMTLGAITTHAQTASSPAFEYTAIKVNATEGATGTDLALGRLDDLLRYALTKEAANLDLRFTVSGTGTSVFTLQGLDDKTTSVDKLALARVDDNVNLDFENPAHAVLELVIQANTAAGDVLTPYADQGMLTITIATTGDVNEAPILKIAPINTETIYRTFGDPATTLSLASAYSDQDAGDSLVLTPTLKEVQGNRVIVEVAAATDGSPSIVISDIKMLDPAPIAGTYNVTLSVAATDKAGESAREASTGDIAKPIEIPVVVRVGANNPPAFTAGVGRAEVTCKENANTCTNAPNPNTVVLNATSQFVGGWVAQDLESDVLKYSVKGAVKGSLDLSPGVKVSADAMGNVWVTPALDFEGGANSEIELVVSDPFGGSASIAISLVVENVDEPPVVDDKKLATLKPSLMFVGHAESGTTTVDLSQYVTDPEGDALTYSATSADKTKAAVAVTGSMLTVTAVAEAASVAITFTATDDDPKVGSDSGSFSVSIKAEENTDPSFMTDGIRYTTVSATVSEGAAAGAAIGTFAATDADTPGDTLTYTITGTDAFSVSATGKVSVKAGGMLNFETDPKVAFRLNVSDGWGGEAFVRVVVDVTDAEDAPFVVTAALPGEAYVVPLGETVAIEAAMFFDDEDADDKARLNITGLVEDERVATAVISAVGTVLVTGVEVGETTIDLEASDGVSDPAKTMVEISVVPNTLPVVANAIADQEIALGYSSVIDIGNVFEDAEGDVTVSAPVSSDEMVVLTSNVDADSIAIIAVSLGEASITLTATDKAGQSVSHTFDVTVIEPLDPPAVAMEIADVTVNMGASATVDISGTFMHEELAMLNFAITSNDDSTAAGTVDGTTVTVVGVAAGSAEITVTATDRKAQTASDTFVVTVNAAPAVVASIADLTVTAGVVETVDISGTFSDPDGMAGEALTLEVAIANASLATVTLASGTISVNGIDPGTTTITVTATDTHGATSNTSFGLSVETMPQAVGSIAAIVLDLGGDAGSVNVSSAFQDRDGDALTYSFSLSNTDIVNGSISGSTVNLVALQGGSSTGTVVASDPAGRSASQSFSITVDDANVRAVASNALAGYGRSVLSSVSDAISSRMSARARSSDLSIATVADAFASAAPTNAALHSSSIDALTDADPQGASPVLSNYRNQLQPFSFKFGAAEGPGTWTVWGNADRQSYEGEGYDGIASSLYLGLDIQTAECWMFGAVVARNSGESEFAYGSVDRDLETSLTTVIPYVRYEPNTRTTFYGAFGIGNGDAEVVGGPSTDSSDLEMNMFLAGGRREVGSTGNLDLVLRGEYASATLTTADDESGISAGMDQTVNRLRAGIEGSFSTSTGNGGTLTPFVDVGVRQDGGDGDTGTGVEITGGVRVDSTTFTMQAKARQLLLHSIDDYTETGIGVTATLHPSGQGTGLSWSINPSWGDGTSSLGVFSNQVDFTQVASAYGLDSSGFSVASRLGYSMKMMSDQFLVTPYLDYDRISTDRTRILLGTEVHAASTLAKNLRLEVAVGNEKIDQSSDPLVGFNASMSF